MGAISSQNQVIIECFLPSAALFFEQHSAKVLSIALTRNRAKPATMIHHSIRIHSFMAHV